MSKLNNIINQYIKHIEASFSSPMPTATINNQPISEYVEMHKPPKAELSRPMPKAVINRKKYIQDLLRDLGEQEVIDELADEDLIEDLETN